MLGSGPEVHDVVRSLYSALLRLAREESDNSTLVECAACLGELGAVDPSQTAPQYKYQTLFLYVSEREARNFNHISISLHHESINYITQITAIFYFKKITRISTLEYTFDDDENSTRASRSNTYNTSSSKENKDDNTVIQDLAVRMLEIHLVGALRQRNTDKLSINALHLQYRRR